jgi:hypothetical protein
MVQVRLTHAFRYVVVVGARESLQRRGTPERPEDLLKHECITYYQLRARRLRRVLEPYAAQAPGYFIYFPSSAQRCAPLRLFVEAAGQSAVRRMDQPV